MLKNNQASLNFLLHERKFALNTSAVDVCWALIAKIWQELFLSVVYWRLLLYSNPNPNSKNPLATTKLFRVVWTKNGPPPIFFFNQFESAFIFSIFNESDVSTVSTLN